MEVLTKNNLVAMINELDVILREEDKQKNNVKQLTGTGNDQAKKDEVLVFCTVSAAFRNSSFNLRILNQKEKQQIANKAEETWLQISIMFTH